MRHHLFPLLLAAGCSGGSIQSAQDTQGKADGFSTPVWLHCDAAADGSGFFGTVTVTCQREASPVLSDVMVQLDGKRSTQTIDLKQAGQPASQRFYSDDLPIKASAQLILKWPDADFSRPTLLTAAGTLDHDGAGFTVDQPFTTWSLTVASDAARVIKLARFTVPLGSLTTSRGESSFEVSSQAVARPAQPASLFVPVPPGTTGLDADLFDGATHKVVRFDAPGDWYVDATGAHPGKPPATDPPATDPPATDPPATDPQPTPSPSSAPAPTCGTDGQSPCSGVTCAAGFVYQDWNYQCHACGRDLEPACAGLICDAGFIYQDWNYQCHACGADGLVACAGGICDAGLEYRWDGLCHTP